MTDMAASVLARLKMRANERGIIFQRCLQLFLQEEFMRRLEQSKYGENFILKGGLLIYSITEFESRITKDMDFLLRNVPNTADCVKEIVSEIIATPTQNDFVSFEIRSICPIAIAKQYPGVGVVLVGRIKNTKTPFGIDFGFGDIVFPKPEKRKIPTQLAGFNAPEVNAYTLETTVAEKLDAILNLMDASSRMKDYYDINYLSHKFDFEGANLVEALRRTFENRGHNFTLTEFEDLLCFDSNKKILARWEHFRSRECIQSDDLGLVLNSIKAFLYEPFVAAVEGKTFVSHWSAANNKWICVD